MKILFVATEAAPIVKVGGIGDVMGSLPKTMAELGHDARVLIPHYGCIDIRHFPVTILDYGVKIQTWEGEQAVNINSTSLDGKIPVYLLDNYRFFGSRPIIYGDNELERFLFFSRAVSRILPQLEWQPDIVHCNDWLTALTIMWLKKDGYPCPSLFTIHNLAYQGAFDEIFALTHDLKQYWESFPPDAPHPDYNYMSQGIIWADRVTTVSETYAREITTSEYGNGLENLLKYRGDSLTGIVNGIDYDVWNPATDPYLPANFTSRTLHQKTENKLALQQKLGLPVNSDIPLIGMVQRLDEQKGFDIFGKAADSILQDNKLQMAVLGSGREQYQNMLLNLAARYPDQLAVSIAFDNALGHQIYGGCDLFLMPSRFEPCGLGQMIAMHYGSIPVVRHTGGLVETVPPLTPDLQQGNGFAFEEYTPEALIAAVNKAMAAFQHKTAWRQAMKRLMNLDFSWQNSARKYQDLYESIIRDRRTGQDWPGKFPDNLD